MLYNITFISAVKKEMYFKKMNFKDNEGSEVIKWRRHAF
jgi:hypothetical protein